MNNARQPETRLVTIQGSTMSVKIAGAGPTVVLGSSFLWDAEMWTPQIEALSSRYRLVVPELWGHGGSGPLPPDTRDMRDLARQHLRLLDELGIERCAIVGLSVGGMWGAELALMAPERVSSLVLMGTSLAAEPEQARESYFAMLDVVGALGTLPDPVREAVLSLFFSPDTQARRPELLEAFDAKLRAWDPQRLKDSVAPLGRIIFGRRDALGDLARLSMPALVMTGDGDLAKPAAEGRTMADRIGCPFLTIPGAGHTSSLEASDFVNRTLAEFLASNSATRDPALACGG